jgi:hypothetical protein
VGAVNAGWPSNPQYSTAIYLANTIIAGNSDKDCDLSPWGTLVTYGHNLDRDGSCQLTAPGDQPGTDPKLGPLQNNTGPTQTHALLQGSPAIDGGDNQYCPTIDQRGVPRPAGAACDIGAYEYFAFNLPGSGR